MRIKPFFQSLEGKVIHKLMMRHLKHLGADELTMQFIDHTVRCETCHPEGPPKDALCIEGYALFEKLKQAGLYLDTRD